jgi:hypothetical protein
MFHVTVVTGHRICPALIQANECGGGHMITVIHVQSIHRLLLHHLHPSSGNFGLLLTEQAGNCIGGKRKKEGIFFMGYGIQNVVPPQHLMMHTYCKA